MCDSEINSGVFEDWSLTRRTFVALTLASMSGAACAAENVVETDVDVKTPDGTCDAVLFHPGGKGKWPAVLMWPDIFGLRPVFREMARRLSTQGYTVLLVNPFYRSKTAKEIMANGQPDMQQNFKYWQAIGDKGLDRDGVAFIGFLDAQPQTDTTKKAGTQGYCMSGGFTFHAAAQLPDRIAAVGSFHGANLVDAKDPESPNTLIPKCKAEFLVCIAQNDDQRQPEAKDVLRKAFAAAQLKATVEVYPANHGWCVPGSRAYDQVAAEKAWAALLQLYKTNLV